MLKNLGRDMTDGGCVDFGHVWHETLLFTIQNQHRVRNALLFTVEALKHVGVGVVFGNPNRLI